MLLDAPVLEHITWNIKFDLVAHKAQFQCLLASADDSMK